MTDKSRKLEDHSSTVKTTRGHPVSHQLATPGLIPTYTLPTEISCHAPPHPHITPYLTPSFGMPHPLTIQGTIPAGANDLGPPIFMPSLNLGIPKSSVSNKSQKASTSNISSIDAVPSSSSSAELFPIICHAPFSTQSIVSMPKGGKPIAYNSVRKAAKQESSVAYSHTVSGPVMTSTSGMNLTANMSIGLVKPARPKSSTIAINIPPEVGHVTYATPTSKYPSLLQYGGDVVHMKRDNKGFIKPEIGFDPAIKAEGGGGISVMTLTSGGSALMCTEGLAPITNATMSRSEQQHRNERINHHDDTGNSGTDNIPWPEAMSKNIIIPAPNLTGKDIANLTSSASSPLSNEKGSNDNHWPTTPTDQSCLDNDVSSSGRNYIDVARTRPQSPLTTVNHLQDSYPGFSITSVTQGSSSPRPSILRKRPLDKSSESLCSPSSSAPGHSLLSRPTNSPSSKPNLICNETSVNDNHHMSRDNNFEITSPRKRPRKQQFESIADDHSIPDALNSHKLSPHSMIAHERLPGPLPLKNKGHVNESEEWTEEKKNQKDKEIMYISQLRKSPYPLAYLNKKSYRGLHKHFRRHADIKHHENSATSIHEFCNFESTWIRTSGWKIHHLNVHLKEIEELEKDVLKMMEDIEHTSRTILDLIPEESIDTTSRNNIQTLSTDTKERTKRSLLHMQETQENMIKILDTNVKVTEIMKKFATNLPVSSSTNSTLVPTSQT